MEHAQRRLCLMPLFIKPSDFSTSRNHTFRFEATITYDGSFIRFLEQGCLRQLSNTMELPNRASHKKRRADARQVVQEREDQRRKQGLPSLNGVLRAYQPPTVAEEK